MDAGPWDNQLLRIIGPEITPERIATGFTFTEGPVWHPYACHLTFSDILGNCLYRWNPAQGISVLRKPSQMANGNTYDLSGRLLTCEHATSRVTRTEPNGQVKVLVSHFRGQELNSPNDIVVKSDGSIYFTDPNSGRGKYGVPRPQQLPFQGIFRLDPADGSLTLLTDDLDKPNGLCFSLDEKQLFISDTNRFHIRVFDVLEDGTLGSSGRVWAEIPRTGVGVPDGMKIDQVGNLYCAGPGGVHLFDPTGAHQGLIPIPEHTTNLAWGDDDLRSLYVTASTSIYQLRVTVPGTAVFGEPRGVN